MGSEYDGELKSIAEELVRREPWRSTAIPIREEYVDWAAHQHRFRQEHGLAKYGPVTFLKNQLMLTNLE